MSFSRIKTLLLMVFAMISNSIGDIFLTQTMRQVGTVQWHGFAQAVDFALLVLSMGKFWLALCLCAVFFFTWMYLMSYEDLSFILPLTALTYIINAFLAGPFLDENVTLIRWAGTALIGIGVVVVSFTTGNNTSKENSEKCNSVPENNC